jgi:hypothetical protein
MPIPFGEKLKYHCVYSGMEAKTQTMPENDRKLKRELKLAQQDLEKCRKEVEALRKRIELFESLVADLLLTCYQGRLKAGFYNLEICTGERCFAFKDYDELIIALRTALLFLK